MQRDGRLQNVRTGPRRVGCRPSPCLAPGPAARGAGIVSRYVAVVDPAKGRAGPDALPPGVADRPGCRDDRPLHRGDGGVAGGDRVLTSCSARSDAPAARRGRRTSPDYRQVPGRAPSRGRTGIRNVKTDVPSEDGQADLRPAAAVIPPGDAGLEAGQRTVTRSSGRGARPA